MRAVDDLRSPRTVAFPFNYNNGIEIHQAPGYVVVRLEMIHEARVVPVDGRAPLDPAIKQWMGESRGHFEGNTLVVETTNFNGLGGMTNVGIPGSPRGDTPTTTNMKITERFTRTDDDTIQYEMYVEDPEVLTQPWKARYPMQRDDSYQFFEYACHEDNTAVRNYIVTSRYERAQAAKTPMKNRRARPGEPASQRARRGLLAVAARSASAALTEPLKLDPGSSAAARRVVAGHSRVQGHSVRRAAGRRAALAAPQPVAKWNGVRDASKFGNVCIQPTGPAEGPGAQHRGAPGSPPMSEDCLYLNVWTGAAAATERRPVMVYFFGGAFTEGAGSVPLYDGDALAKKGAVVVTMNYRLGPYGFFAHPALTAESPHKASGNYGLMDMVASLRWVQSNIAAFGGDPSNVTVFGQSAGAMAIGSLVASPETKGLFHRAIWPERLVDGARPVARDAHARAERRRPARAAPTGRRHDGRAAARDVGGRRHREVPQRRA